jgi:hypothetical protein
MDPRPLTQFQEMMLFRIASKSASIRVTPFGYSESRVIPVLQSELRSTTLDGIVLRSSSL